MAIVPAANAEDYVSAYGEVADTNRLNMLLYRATVMLVGWGYEPNAENEKLTEIAKTVVCNMVNRVLSSDPTGDGVAIKQLTQSATPYSVSYTLANPNQDMYITAAERRALGLGRIKVSQIRPGCWRDEQC